MMDARISIKDDSLVVELPELAYQNAVDGFRDMGAKVWIPNQAETEIKGITLKLIMKRVKND